MISVNNRKFNQKFLILIIYQKNIKISRETEVSHYNEKWNILQQLVD